MDRERGPLCSICTLPTKRLNALEQRLVEGASAGAVGKEFGVSKWTVMRHSRKCMPAELGLTVAAERLLNREGLLDAWTQHLVACDIRISRFRAEGDRTNEVRAAESYTRALTGLSRVLGEMPTADITVNISTIQIAAGVEIAHRIMPILDGHPELQHRVAAALAPGRVDETAA